MNVRVAVFRGDSLVGDRHFMTGKYTFGTRKLAPRLRESTFPTLLPKNSSLDGSTHIRQLVITPASRDLTQSYISFRHLHTVKIKIDL